MHTTDLSNKASTPSEVVSRPDLVAAANGEAPPAVTEANTTPANVVPIKPKSKKERRAEKRAAKKAAASAPAPTSKPAAKEAPKSRAPRKGSYADAIDEAIRSYGKHGKREANIEKLMEDVRAAAKRMGKKAYTLSQVRSHLSFRQARQQLKEYSL